MHYNQNYINSKVLIALGGSTTDGLLQNFSNGETWPLQLNRLLKHTNIKVINGGTTEYGTSRELLKLIIDVGNLPYDIKYIVSLNGINEISEVNDINKTILEELPFFSGSMLKMYDSQTWLIRGKYRTSFFPATMSFIGFILGNVYPWEQINSDQSFIPLDESSKNSLLLKDTKKVFS